MPEQPGQPAEAVPADAFVLDGGEAVVVCLKSPAREGANEDAALLIPLTEGRTVLAVADGMGSGPAGERASATAIDALNECMEAPLPADTTLRSAILNGFEAANERVRGLGGGSATTLAVVEVDGGSIRPYHAGDSMILVVGQRGRIRLQTLPHSPTGYAVEAGLLDEEDAIHHEDRHLVSNMVGDAEMRIEIGPVLPLQARDTVVIGSDGLFDNLLVEEIVEHVRKGRLPEAAQRMAVQCMERMLTPGPGEPSKADDLTFVLYRAGD
jgi:serine/threonine protein phosphatase PrpC